MVTHDSIKFEMWLKNNTSLRASTIRLYLRTIEHYIRLCDNPLDVQEMNVFISNSIRKVNSYYVKYAFAHWLRFMKKEGMYKKLVKVKQQPRKKLGKFVSPRTIHNLIKNIESLKHRHIAWLQFATGARAREILMLHSEHIDIDSYPDVIRIRLVTKRGKEQSKFLDREKFLPILERYLKTEKEDYLFIKGFDDTYELERVVNNERSYYYNSIQESAKQIGISSFGTHDFRRNVAEMLKKQNKNPLMIKQFLGHARLETTVRYFDDNPEDILETSREHQNNIEM